LVAGKTTEVNDYVSSHSGLALLNGGKLIPAFGCIGVALRDRAAPAQVQL
jgi:hypothetical protein